MQSDKESAQVLMVLEGRVRGPGLTEAAQVVADDPMLLRQWDELGVPHAAVEVAPVEQHDGRSASSGFVEKVCAVDDNRAGVDVQRWSSPMREAPVLRRMARPTRPMRSRTEQASKSHRTSPRHLASTLQ